MTVCHYFEWEEFITGGQAQSVKNQRRMLDRHGIDYVTEPTLDVDLLHLNNMGPRSLYYAKRARRQGVPVVAHTHQTAEDFRESFAFSNLLARPMRPYLEYAYAQADHLICPSDHTADVLAEYCDTPRTVVSNGFDPEKLAGHERLRAEYLDRYDLDPPVVFMVGHVIERKGLSTFVETARRLPELDFAWFGYLNPGGGTLDRVLRSRETTKHVTNAPDNCTFTGYVEDVRGAFAAGDIFFFPTKNENEGMALLEAMACGKPPVVSAIPTFEWLEDGTTCLKAQQDFTDPLDRVASDADLRDRIGTAAAEASESYTIEAVSEDLVAVYRSLLDE
ncbi:MAG: 1,2-diacylglycerol-3-alpha-glucose alpha-1,2-glucosyltransferase [Haloarculaceae archaeon]|jgi:1,2-diacylglycerol-3-alpha-glucose alpha-1,2-glucosyltransferase